MRNRSIAKYFQNLPKKEKVVWKWKDSDGDLVTLSTKEELAEALRSTESRVFEIHLVEKKLLKLNGKMMKKRKRTRLLVSGQSLECSD